MDRKKKPVILVCVLILVVALVGVAVHVIMKYVPTRQRMDLNEYYGQVADGQCAIIVGTERLESRGLVSDNKTYIPIDVVDSYINQRYYWDSEGQQVLYATPTQLTSQPAQVDSGSEVWLKDGVVYLSVDYIKQYTDIDAYVYTDPARITIQKQFSGIQTVQVQKDTYVRYQGGIKSPVLTKVSKGDSLIFMQELENWTQVATWDGYIGYIEKSRISVPEDTTLERDFQAEQYNYITMDQKVNMVWHQVMSQEANSTFAEATQNMTGVNVISPTWFAVQDNAGNISNIATADYVAQAHEKGLKIWGLVDNFSENVNTSELLAKTSARQNLISQLVNAAVGAGIDGINVDFEYLKEDVGVHFLEFLRELSIECHKNNLVLSVDNPPPAEYTSHYDRAEQGRVVDYVVIMGYDEHYVGSEEAGSVASLPWVEQGIQDTLAEVPAERVINAMPFYTRLWKTEAGTLSSEAIGMDAAAEVLATNNAETYWDNTTSQQYGEYEKDNCAYKIWVENADSIAAKVQLAVKYNLAGVSAWKLGFENSGIWQVISDNLAAAQ
ncbi:MAG: glycosyl hydrolase family 18 protein [Blautia sp.]|nr:glycosyl hydrolase family 18 protein [Blautia sp.]